MDIVVITKLVWDNWNTLLFLFDEACRPLSVPDFCNEAGKAVTPRLLTQLWKQAQQKQTPDIYIDTEHNLYYWGFTHEKGLYVIGPLHATPLSFTQERHFLHQQKIHRKDFPLKELTLAESIPVISLIYYCLTGKQCELLKDQEIWPALQSELITNRLDAENEGRTHLPYLYEQEWCQYIQEGEDPRLQMKNDLNLLDRVGLLAKDNAFKQAEYTTLSQIVLASRAAIKGGLSPVKAYELSDLLLQKCSECQEVTELFQIGAQTVDVFLRAVREVRKSRTKDLDVEHCKNYIACHLTEKLSVASIACELNISYSYLAAKFQRETNGSIKKYILREKLAAAANLLKYSETNVGDIAEYLAFSSASNMCSHFREQYGMSPLEYRQTQKPVDFRSSEYELP